MFRISKTVLAAFAVITLSLSGASALAQKDPTVGGAAMYSTKNIVENAVNSPRPHHSGGRREGGRSGGNT